MCKCVMILLDSILLLLSPKYLVHNKMDEQNYHPDIQRPRGWGEGRETQRERERERERERDKKNNISCTFGVDC
jgi:hypothetical protein